MKTENAFVGARVVDSYPFSKGGTARQAERLRETGIDALAGYLGAINDTRIGYLFNAGLAFMPVSFAGEYFDGSKDEVDQLKALGIPAGVTVWHDLEGMKSYKWPVQDLIRLLGVAAKHLTDAGYIAGLYIGSPQPLTGDELAKLPHTRYWKAPSRIIDRNGKVWDGPSGIGHCMFQMWPQRNWPNDTDPDRTFVDLNMIGQDFRGRVPTWVRG